MRLDDVCLEAIGAEIPDEIWSSEDIERQLQPLYDRLKLPPGRLEMMSGIDQRRVWPVGTMPSTPSIRAANAAIEASAIDRSKIGCLIHASVCRDFLEPATASRVHHELGLRPDCWVYDVSNACLGIVNGAVQIALMIQAGVIQAGVVVGTENARMLLEQTIRHLNETHSYTRQSVKPAFASLTIGSGSAAFLLCHRDLARSGTTLVATSAWANTAHHDLCRSDQDAGGASMQPLMETDSEKLMVEGIATGVNNFEQLLQRSRWSREQIDRTVCHQVGSRHRIAMLQSMDLAVDRDSFTFDRLGNTGSVALPLTLAHAANTKEIRTGHRVAMLGIGSGINSVMMTAQWGQTPIAQLGTWWETSSEPG
jgi:acyl-CoA:acyl-CoA alkyltransferase